MMTPINFDFYRELLLIFGVVGQSEIFQEGLFVRKSKINAHRAMKIIKKFLLIVQKLLKLNWDRLL